MSYLVSFKFEKDERVIPTIKEALVKAYKYTKEHPRNTSVEIYKNNDFYEHLYTVSWQVVDGKRQIVLFKDSNGEDDRYQLLNADGSRKSVKLQSYHVQVKSRGHVYQDVRFRTVNSR